MREPKNAKVLSRLENVLVTQLDVNNFSSIKKSVEKAISHFGRIDVLLNNAGYSVYSPLESTTEEQIHNIFNTNVFGALEVIKAITPIFRSQHNGMIINVSSIGGKMTFPLGCLYYGTKYAIEGISEALTWEMQSIGVKVKIIEPGFTATEFRVEEGAGKHYAEYDNLKQKLYEDLLPKLKTATPPQKIAEVILQAATDESDELRYPTGDYVVEWMALRSKVDDATFLATHRKQMGL
ncbi:short chain dehydrogenase, implicated in cellular detoxification [Schizosaccharomyces pombe]|uniref:Uncharacterized oxidoreductase SPBC1348.09 n=2 Tax=Schizosaccharomyces pombe (strain 972 / ATCC 24843) TaxID=284812 RepID=YI49_SCHPO|nr:putative dehydrogenase [Schizosaccharomyces pombe]NP_592780.1 putative dehydrogenase [Schizosaccharomyces pombe]P0CU00.1 RecName: Full=Uncharacterized oxidoreductase SPAC977.08 [Schizosaccharomyces pombe 972h-]P0CU01.1 RecName: Full=Uncharacterized oxidoreductase SPBC1348.09 [Schizosaccharomyces pombe 972h-]CAB69630.1 short chain dehydrogenase (predicted) [Schizosaccharomyces pombe]CAB94276.1 short chain dehydrogenase (predicted) [Schizosaccharomyces pombe]|eukprot:NP_592771.1 putative dehydrogenase [Schizosaccharomyces pombe]